MANRDAAADHGPVRRIAPFLACYLMLVGHWRGHGLVWTTRTFSVGSWSPWFDRDHIPNAVVAPDGRLRLRSRR